jgi:hypothetical protein
MTAAVLAAAGAARADEKADARAVIARAIKAVGGKEKLAGQKAVTFKAKGKYYGMGEAIDYTSEYAIQPPDKIRFQMAFEVNGMKFAMHYVFDGKKGWLKFNDQTTALDRDGVAEAREEMYAGGVETLAALVKGKGFELSPVGEVKVGEHEAVGIRVSHKGHRDINLFFDKKTGLLLKSERTIKDQQMGGKERTQETLFSDYKEVDGVKQAMKYAIRRDGKKYADSEFSDFETKDKIEDSEFAKP